MVLKVIKFQGMKAVHQMDPHHKIDSPAIIIQTVKDLIIPVVDRPALVVEQSVILILMIPVADLNGLNGPVADLEAVPDDLVAVLNNQIIILKILEVALIVLVTDLDILLREEEDLLVDPDGLIAEQDILAVEQNDQEVSQDVLQVH